MLEHYQVIGHARGEPRPVGCVGVRVCVGLSGFPRRPWCHAFAGRLTAELTGHAAVGHLQNRHK